MPRTYQFNLFPWPTFMDLTWIWPQCVGRPRVWVCFREEKLKTCVCARVCVCHMTLRQSDPLLGRRLYLCRPRFWHASFSLPRLMTRAKFRPSITDLAGIFPCIFASCSTIVNHSVSGTKNFYRAEFQISAYPVVINVILVGEETRNQLQYHKDSICSFPQCDEARAFSTQSAGQILLITSPLIQRTFPWRAFSLTSNIPYLHSSTHSLPGIQPRQLELLGTVGLMFKDLRRRGAVCPASL